MATPEETTFLVIPYIIIISIIDIYVYYHGLSLFDSFGDAKIMWGGYWHEARKYARGIPRDRLKEIWKNNTLLMLSLHILLLANFILLAYGYLGLFIFLMVVMYPLSSIFVSFYTIETLRKEYLLQRGDMERCIMEENPQFQWEKL